MKTRTLLSEQWFPLPIQRVFDFFSDAGNLDIITPPWLGFHIVTPRPIVMKPGALIDYKLRIRGLPISWRTEIVEWDPPHKFVDVQLKGPYRLWHHQHFFEEKDGGTLVRDQVDYRVPGWILEPLVHRFFVKPDLDKVFAYRRESIEKELMR